MKKNSHLIRTIAILLCLPFLLGTVTHCSCDGRDLYKDLNTTKGYFEDNRRPEGMEKYDDIIYSLHKKNLDRLEKIYLSDEPGTEERRNDEAKYWEYKYDIYSDWDKKIKLRELDGETREEAVKEVAIEEILKEKTMNWDDAEEYFDENWGYLFTEETDETEKTEETTLEETSLDQQDAIDAWIAFLDGIWVGEIPVINEDVQVILPPETQHDFKGIPQLYIEYGIPMSIEEGTGALVVPPSDFFEGYTIYKIDDNTIKIVFPDKYDPNEYTYTRTRQ